MANFKARFLTLLHVKEQDTNGQALVEFAFVLLFIILPVTFVLVDGAVTLFTLANVTNATREAARGGSIYQFPTGFDPDVTFANQVATIDAARSTFIQQQARGMLGPLVAFSQCTTMISYSPTVPVTGNPYRALDSMTVQLACPRRLLFGLVSASTITLTGQSTMRIEPGGIAPTP